MERIISFSLWGTDPKYLIGAEENVKLQKEVYPDWTCRFYVDRTVPVFTLDNLISAGAEIVYRENSDGYRGLFWRFEPGFDNTIERFIVRDCDSRLNKREASAVQEWIDSGLPFHSMRDHKGHDIIILGAMWGAVPFFIPDFESLYKNFLSQLDEKKPFYKRAAYFYFDQHFLNRIIWPRVSNKCLIHDDLARFTKTEKPFSVKLEDGFFVGQQFGADNKPLGIPI